jgi:hypothetical protein
MERLTVQHPFLLGKQKWYNAVLNKRPFVICKNNLSNRRDYGISAIHNVDLNYFTLFLREIIFLIVKLYLFRNEKSIK